jgi:hypothetical protein
LARTLALLSLTHPPSAPRTTSSPQTSTSTSNLQTTTTLTLALYLHVPTTIARTEKEWAEMASKYGYGIDADEATKEEMVEFVQTVIYLHKTEDLTDNDLWLVFQEQFEGFTVESFKKIRTETRSKLRRHLLKRGVYVGQHSNRVTISELLFEVIQREELHQWTDEDIKTTIKELAEPMHTRALRDRLNQTLDGLATGPKLTQPTATAIIPPRTQIPQTATGPESAQPAATAIIPPGTQSQPTATATIPPGTQSQPTATATIPPGTQTQPTATATVPPGIQILTPITPQTPTAFTPQQAAPTATQQQYHPQTPVAFTPQQAAPTATQQQYYPQTPVAFVPYQTAQQQYNLQQPAQQQYNPQQLTQQHTLLQSTLQQPPDPGGGMVSYKKEAATVAKMYTDSQKYDKVSESFDFKLTIFKDICRRAGLQLDDYMIAFPTMLKGLAQDHYYNCSLSAKTYTEACTYI